MSRFIATWFQKWSASLPEIFLDGLGYPLVYMHSTNEIRITRSSTFPDKEQRNVWYHRVHHSMYKWGRSYLHVVLLLITVDNFVHYFILKCLQYRFSCYYEFYQTKRGLFFHRLLSLEISLLTHVPFKDINLLSTSHSLKPSLSIILVAWVNVLYAF